MRWSPPARLLVRPFRAYEELARSAPEDAPTVVGGAFRLLFVIGAFVAITATGRLAPVELAVATFSFAYVPVAQLVALAAALKVVSRPTPIARAFALYLAGHGPAIVVLLTISAACLVVPAERTARVLLASVPFLLLAMLVWGGVLTFACFRSGLGLGRLRSGAGVAAHTIVLTSLVLGYFLGMGQLGPLLWL